MDKTAVWTLAATAAALAACERGERATREPAGDVAPIVAAPAGAAPSSFSPIVKRVLPAVVSIDTLAVGEPVFGPAVQLPEGVVPGFAVPVRRGAGSGFFISAD